MNFRKYFLLILSCYLGIIEVSSQTQIGETFIGQDFIGRLGSSTDLSDDGSVLAMGSGGDTEAGVGSGKVYVYELNGNSWNLKGDIINGEGFSDSAGRSLALSSDGNTVAIHSPGIGTVSEGLNQGHVRVFSWNGTEWLQMGENIQGMAEDEVLGRGLDISADGKTLAVGSPSGRGTGYVQIYKWQNDQWELKGLNGEMEGLEIGAMFGFSISLSQNGNMLAIGSVYSEDLGPKTGKVETFFYDNISDEWFLLGNPIIGEAEGDAFGWDVLLAESANTMAIAGPNNDEAFLGAGHVQVYDLNTNDEWEQVGMDIDGEAFGNSLGSSIDLSNDGNRLIVGARQNADAGQSAGKTYVFDRSENGEYNLSIDPILGLESLDTEGFKVSISGDGAIFTTSAPSHDGEESAAGMVRAFLHPNPVTSTLNHLENSYSLFPNPTKGIIQLENTEHTIEGIYNAQGQMIMELKRKSHQMDLRNYPAGTYFLKIRSEEKIHFQKVIKN